MSHYVVRGAAYPSQLYLDAILDEVARKGVTGARGGEGASLPQILLHCLRKNPHDVFMINGETGDKITNGQILNQSVSLARALVSKGARGKTVLIVMRNHQTMAAVYFAVLFSGTVPFIMDPNTTVFEITHFLKLIAPSHVFCDEEHYTNVNTALNALLATATATATALRAEVHRADTDELLKEFAKGCSEEADSFQIPDADLDDTVMMLPTSGSTGLPKATLMTHRGLVAQLPISWAHHTQFPTPTRMTMLLTTPQWVTFTMLVTSCVVYRVPVLMARRKPTVQWVKEMLITYRPTWTFFGPAFVKTLLPAITEDHLSSLETLLVLGAPCSIELKEALKDKLPGSAHLGDVYGTTETQGYINFPDPKTPINSTGKVINLFEYKLMDDNGQKLGLCETGELCVKGPSIMKGYHNNKKAFNETVIDGWLRTGDLFYIDDQERLIYQKRKKFTFKFLGCHVSPEEIELVIGSVDGVEECVVCPTERGPAAAVVARGPVSRETIHLAVNAALSEHKRLHGGIAFVPTLPLTHSGKTQRSECKVLVQQLIDEGKCFQ